MEYINSYIITKMEKADFSKENEELLQAEPEEAKDQSPKRNSKSELIQRILDMSKQHNIELEHSDTRLSRMNKKQLQELLAEQMEKIMRGQMADAVGADRMANDQTIALSALRMIHDIVAKGAEVGFNQVGEPYGYHCEGFSDTLKEPIVSQAVDQCLAEIAAENQEILDYVKSPYARLALAWAGCAMTCVSRVSGKKHYIRNRRYATPMGPKPSDIKNPDERGADRRAEDGKNIRVV